MSISGKLKKVLSSVSASNMKNTNEYITNCICGFNIGDLKDKLAEEDFETIPMAVLFKNNFDWKSSHEQKTVKKVLKDVMYYYPSKKATLTTRNFWSMQDMGWLNMHMQAALMLGVLQGLDLVISTALNENEEYNENKKGEPAAACEIQMFRVINENFYDFEKAERKPFSRPFNLFRIKQFGTQNKDMHKLNSDQLKELQTLMGIDENHELHHRPSAPYFWTKRQANEWDKGNPNIVRCPLNNAELFLWETHTVSTFKISTAENASTFTPEIDGDAFIFKKFKDKDTPTDKINLPNRFEQKLCDALLPGTKNTFNRILFKQGATKLTKDEMTTVVEYWKDWCPMITWKGIWLNEEYEAAPKMMNYSKPITEIYGEEFLNNGPVDSIVVQPNPDFDGLFETEKKEIEEEKKKEDEILEEEIQNQNEEIIEEETNDIPKQNQESQEKITEQANNQQEISEPKEEEDKEEKEEIVEEIEEIEEEEDEPKDESIDIEESDEEKACNKRREMLEEIYGTTGYKPRNEKEATEMIANMMGHPHDIPCKHVLPYEITAGEIFLRDPSESVMKYIVKKITPQQLKVAGQDPNFDVFQIHFKNHMFDDEMDALYYIPAREMANEWDKFPNIMMKFCDFSDNNLGSKLNSGLVYTEFFKDFEKFLNSSTNYNFKIETGASGPLNTLGSSTKEEFERIMANPSLQYITYILRINNNTGNDNGGFYDVIFQCWVLNDKYLMVKMSGTQLNYQVMINKYATTAKLTLIFAGMTDALKENFLDTNTAVVSIHKAKQLTFDTMVKICDLYKFTCTENSLDENDGEPIDNTQAHFDVIAEEDNKFMFAMYSEAVEKEFSVRGFIHTRENIPVMNIFFTMDIFQSEYIIPLVNLTDFTSYLNDIYHECYKHLYYMMEQIYLVEDPSTTEEELDKSEALGRYTMKKLVMSVFGMLSKKYVYGCIKTNKVAEAERTKDGGIDDSESAKKRLKWMQPEPFDNTGDFVMLRSNNLYRDHRSVCQAAERQNPLLLQLYSTHLDDRNGYALTINNLDKSQKKDVKTTYHFVKYQDYAHMRVFENFIGNIFNQLFDSKPEKEKKEE